MRCCDALREVAMALSMQVCSDGMKELGEVVLTWGITQERWHAHIPALKGQQLQWSQKMAALKLYDIMSVMAPVPACKAHPVFSYDHSSKRHQAANITAVLMPMMKETACPPLLLLPARRATEV